MTYIYIIYLCIWANSVLQKLTYTQHREREDKKLCDMMILLPIFRAMFIHSKERKREEKRKEQIGSKAEGFFRLTFSYRDVANNADLFKCIQHFSFISPPAPHLLLLSIFRSFCRSNETISSMHSIHFTCHIIHVYVFSISKSIERKAHADIWYFFWETFFYNS